MPHISRENPLTSTLGPSSRKASLGGETERLTPMRETRILLKRSWQIREADARMHSRSYSRFLWFDETITRHTYERNDMGRELAVYRTAFDHMASASYVRRYSCNHSCEFRLKLRVVERCNCQNFRQAASLGALQEEIAIIGAPAEVQLVMYKL